MKIQDFFSEAFYINLDSRPDRKTIFEEELKKYGLETFVKRFSGCIPKLDDVYGDNAKMSYRKHGACGRSHKNIVQYAKEKNLDNVLIFEDDAIFYNDGEESGIKLVESALDTLADTPIWDLFYMGGIIIQDEINEPNGNLLLVENVLTTHAWAINKKCYDYVLKYRPGDGYEKEFDSPIDGCLGRHIDLNKYLVYPLAVYQRENTISDCDLRDGVGRLTVGVSPWLQNYQKKIKQT
jgi:GR25 family glycosyltransferase involved in LPS biosynthesis